MAAAPSTLNMASVLLLLLLFSVHWPGRSHAFSLMNYLCNNGSSYAINSTYRSNVVALLGSLSANASSSVVGFATGTLGHAPDQTWGLALCRGDVNGSGCASCLALAPDIAFGNCRGVRDVSIYYDRCLLRYSDTDFLASPGDASAPVQYGTNLQCTPNQAPEACLTCLGRLKDEMPAVFNGSTGGQFNAVWCNLRFEVFLFYDSSPVVKLVAPPLTPDPSGAAVHDDAKRTRGAGNAATVVAIVLGVLLVILLSTFMMYLWRKAQVKQYAEEADDSGSLLFDLATLRRATTNFAEENKLGHGGFGAVYKMWDHWVRGTTLEAVDPSLDRQAPETESEVVKCIHLGLLCVQENPVDRPTMLDVLVMLHGQSSGFAAPSKPAFAFAYGETMSSDERRDVSSSAAAAAFSLNGMSVSEFQPR
ncbi:unnamed protein product [Miscanthus lutarioriparius]|uniref:Gnk2-homologous domain-containing protein n=1 Tax=Miscanthus lutarioriparius TaxID=422564 RepID=A0A811SGJ9_9POAL|nr:unnamed protein product [Miscanthus lutarioriparius]